MEKYKCPICENISMIEGDASFTCTHFKDMNDKCNYVFWKRANNVDFTLDDLKNLAENGHTDYKDMKSKAGKEFSARFEVLDNEGVKTVIMAFKSAETNIDCLCPKCNENLTETLYAYKCSNEQCDFYINKNFQGMQIDEDLLQELINGERRYGEFVTKNEKIFYAWLSLDEEFKTKLDFVLGTCPKCKEGDISEREKMFTCSRNKKDDEQCNFIIWKSQKGGVITYQDVLDLIENGSTKYISFYSKEGEKYKAKYVINDNDELIFVR